MNVLLNDLHAGNSCPMEKQKNCLCIFYIWWKVGEGLVYEFKMGVVYGNGMTLQSVFIRNLVLNEAQFLML